MEQRELLREIYFIRAEIPGDADDLIASLPLAEKYKNAKELERRLVNIRKRGKKAGDYLKIFKNPLYTLNESTRIFILQGEMNAVAFIYESLLLMGRLQRGKNGKGVNLPKRIKMAMQQWWEQEGKVLLAEAREKITGENGQRLDGDRIRKPIIKFDPVDKKIKVILPRQPVDGGAEARFYIQGESGQRQEIILPIIIENDHYWSEAAELILKYPEPLYYLRLDCGSGIHSWQIRGIGLDDFCLLFNMQGELLREEQLPGDGIYVITPIGSSIDPVENIKERLAGHWSDYEYRFIDLENKDVVVIRVGEDVSVYKRLAKLQPTLLSRKMIHGITAGEAAIYQGQLPDLLFSIDHPKEIQFYGLRLEAPEKTVYKPLEDLKPIIHKNNEILVPLSDLVKGGHGSYRIILEKRNGILWSENFAVVPDLKLSFDRQIYMVQDDFKETGILKFSSEYKCEFTPDPRATNTVWSTTPNVVEFDTCIDNITGNLTYDFSHKFTLETNIQIPAIRWRRWV